MMIIAIFCCPPCGADAHAGPPRAASSVKRNCQHDAEGRGIRLPMCESFTCAPKSLSKSSSHLPSAALSLRAPAADPGLSGRGR
eukprot:1599818-Pleurochrysis_carterae.AAC.2